MSRLIYALDQGLKSYLGNENIDCSNFLGCLSGIGNVINVIFGISFSMFEVTVYRSLRVLAAMAEASNQRCLATLDFRPERLLGRGFKLGC
jgi:hypothetical protein